MYLGAISNSWAGTSVAVVGDVNTDGAVDFLVGACSMPTTQPGIDYLVYGQTMRTSITMSTVSPLTFELSSGVSKAEIVVDIALRWLFLFVTLT